MFPVCYTGIVTEQLQLFLERNLPKSTKAKPVTLGVSDHKLGAAITEALGVSCTHIGVVPEIIRGKTMEWLYNAKSVTNTSQECICVET